MSSYRRVRPLFNALRREIPRTSVHESTPNIARNPPFSSYSSYNSRVSEFSRPPLFSSIFSHIRRKGCDPNPLFGGTRRFYRANSHNANHFILRVTLRLFRYTVWTAAVGSGVLITAYFWMSETIPYTNRTHLVLVSRNMEKAKGEEHFEELKKSLKFRGMILPAMDPECVRLRGITENIMEALQRGPSQERSPWYAALREIINCCWGKDDGFLNWEVLVVNSPDLAAVCFPGGKIVVSLGLLLDFRNDSEIATIIAHEVGHAVARHTAETATKELGLAILKLVSSKNFVHEIRRPELLPFPGRMEVEADYIGLLLMASAGYDPRIAPKVYEKLEKMEEGRDDRHGFQMQRFSLFSSIWQEESALAS